MYFTQWRNGWKSTAFVQERKEFKFLKASFRQDEVNCFKNPVIFFKCKWMARRPILRMKKHGYEQQWPLFLLTYTCILRYNILMRTVYSIFPWRFLWRGLLLRVWMGIYKQGIIKILHKHQDWRRPVREGTLLSFCVLHCKDRRGNSTNTFLSLLASYSLDHTTGNSYVLHRSSDPSCKSLLSVLINI